MPEDDFSGVANFIETLGLFASDLDELTLLTLPRNGLSTGLRFWRCSGFSLRLSTEFSFITPPHCLIFLFEPFEKPHGLHSTYLHRV